MSTLKEIIDEHGFECKIGWRNTASGKEETCVLDKFINSESEILLSKSTRYSLLNNKLSDYYYISGGNKKETETLDRDDFMTIDKISAKVLDQLRNEVLKDAKDYAENDLPELINDLLTKGECIKLSDKILDLAKIAELLMELGVMIDDYTYVPQEIKK